MHELKTMANEVHNCSLRGLVFDLQGNPGGPLSSALDVASLFLPAGTPLLRVTAHNKTQIFKCVNCFPDVLTPLLLLVDSRTASASEIFATALLDHHRAVAAGTRTVGKNVAQVKLLLNY